MSTVTQQLEPTLPPVAPGRRVNVLIVASSLWIGGTETVIRHLAQSIDRNRFNLTVCYLKQRGQIGDELVRAGIDIVGIAASEDAPVDYLSFRKLLDVIRRKNIDVVHTHTAHGLVDTSICRLFRPSLKVIHTFHFGNYPHINQRILWMERIFSRAATRLFAVGEVQRAQLVKALGLRDRSIRTLWNGVTQPGSGDTQFRVRVGATGKVLIGTVATLIEQKGLRDLMKVAKELEDLRGQIQFVVVGEGHLRPELEAMRKSLGLDDMVTLTGWVTSAADVALPTFDIFFQPSLWEAMSVVTLEAMAAGRPTVTTRVGEASHVIEHGVDGLLVDVNDVQAMAQHLRRLVNDPALRSRLGAAASAKVKRSFTVEQMARAYEREYLAVTGPLA